MDIQAGKEPYAPQPSNAKKRSGTITGHFFKKLRQRDGSGVASGESVREHSVENPSNDGDFDMAQPGSARGPPLTAATITAKISELRGRQFEAQSSKSDLQDRLDRVRGQRDGLRQERADKDSEILTMCILARNNYSRQAIQRDYAAGIRELDEELAAEEDEANFDPGVELRDYDEIAHNFPVFCVSARAYQSHNGNSPKDRPMKGFRRVENTGIPSLQKVLVQADFLAASVLLTGVFASIVSN